MTDQDDGPGEWWDRLQPAEPEQVKKDRPLATAAALVVVIIGVGVVGAVGMYLLAFELIPYLFEFFLGPADADPVVPVTSTIGP